MRTFAGALLSSVIIAQTTVTVDSFGDNETSSVLTFGNNDPSLTVTKTGTVAMPYTTVEWSTSTEWQGAKGLNVLMANLDAEITSKRAELDSVIKNQKDFVLRYQAGGGDDNSIVGKQTAINSAELARNQAEEDFQSVFNKNKAQFEKLKLQASSAKAEWDQASTLVITSQ